MPNTTTHPTQNRPSPPPPLALYIHIPWCVKKCPYCDFNSHPQRGDIDQQGYVDALIRDLDHDIAVYGGGEGGVEARGVSSIFIGGGTPSLFGADSIDRLLRAVRARLRFADAIEITLEANPGGVEHDDFAAYRAAGVNRLSLGVQSFNDAHLEKLGRIHDAAEAKRAIRAACDAGFANLNVDLMYGLPQQTAAAAMRDLASALEFSPSHLSMYQLTIEPNTLFHRHPPRLPNDERIADMQRRLHERATRHGYDRYEVSAYARPGMRCRHNLNYWEFGDYLGIGAGAHGKITRGGDIVRYWKQKHPRRYLASAGGEQALGETSTIARRDVLFEFLMNALRLTDGFDTALLSARTGRDAGEVVALLSDALSRRLVVLEGGGERVKCSEKGYRFLDDILQQVLPG